jgi:hypothetical protein
MLSRFYCRLFYAQDFYFKNFPSDTSIFNTKLIYNLVLKELV